MSEELLKETVIELSIADNWEEAKMEWTKAELVKIDADRKQSCLCGHKSLKKVFAITRNDGSGIELSPIGSSCIEKFENEELTKSIKRAEKIYKLKKNLKFEDLREVMDEEMLEDFYSKGYFKEDKENEFNPWNDYILFKMALSRKNEERQLAYNKIERIIYVINDYLHPELNEIFDIESYKGKKVTLTFAIAKTTDMGLAEIKQSAEYNFNYNEKYRPSYHFTPQYGWMNDPNGMVYLDGVYHLFFQYNPYGARWGNMHWGHAISKDLVNWQYQPTAIAPDKLGAIFSGSAVIDHDNTAGFGKGAMIAIFTSAGDRQTQSIAYSLDGGKTFTKYQGNPVLTDANIIDFRDPKVFWHAPSKQWVMSLATTQTITFYGSKNLKEWTRLSEFGEGLGGHGGVWECPDLFPLTYEGKTKWVLFVSINPGGPNGGSATQYFIGNFDGKTFTPDTMDYPLWLDYGRDNYAGVTWSNVPTADGRRLFIGWMSNWDYANEIPTVNFRSAMTVARTLRLAHNGEHLVVASEPVKELESLRREPLSLADKTTSDTVTFENFLPNNQGAYELIFTVTPNDTDSFSFSIENTKGEVLTYLFDIANKTLLVDRTKSSVAFNANFAETPIKAPLTAKKSYTVRLLVDKASTELFVNNGEVVQTNAVFPTEVYNTLRFKTEKGTLNLNDITLYKLK